MKTKVTTLTSRTITIKEQFSWKTNALGNRPFRGREIVYTKNIHRVNVTIRNDKATQEVGDILLPRVSCFFPARSYLYAVFRYYLFLR